MSNPIGEMSLSLALSPLADIFLCVGIILAIGFYLWNKGRYSILSKR